jgi:uncharacterized protein (TIGR02246 family)
MRTRSLLLMSGLSLFGAACTRPDDAAATADSAAGVAATSADAGAVREAIEASNAKYVDAMKRADTTVLAAIYAEDAVVMMPNTERWRGLAAVRSGLGAMLTQMSVKDVRITTDDVMLGGDLAVESGTYETTLQPRGGAEIKDKGKYVVVWKRQTDGSWKIIREANNSDLPVSAPPKR